MPKTIDELINLFEGLQQDGFGGAEVFVDTDTTLGFAHITEVEAQSDTQVVIR